MTTIEFFREMDKTEDEVENKMFRNFLLHLHETGIINLMDYGLGYLINWYGEQTNEQNR